MKTTALIEGRHVPVASAHPPATLADLRDALPSLYSAASAASYASKIVKAARLLGEPAELLPADPHRLEERLRAVAWAGQFRGASEKAKARAFEDLVSRIVGMCLRFAAARSTAPGATQGADDWAELEAYVAAREGSKSAGAPFPRYASISLANLRRALPGVRPCDVSASVVAAQLPTLSGRRLARLRRSARFFDKLLADPARHPEIASLLPSAPVGTVQRKRAAALDGRRYPAALMAECDAAIARIADAPQAVRDAALDALGDGIDPAEVLAQVRKRKQIRSRAAARRSYGVALRWLIREADVAGVLAPDEMTGLAAVCRYDVIVSVVEHWKEKAAASTTLKTASETSTLNTYLSRLEVVARRALDDPREAARIALLRLTDADVANPYTREMAKDRADFVADLRSTPEAVEALVEAPFSLAREAERALARWDALNHATRVSSLRQLIGAIWLGLQMCRPVRPGDLRRYTHRGPNPNIVAPKTGRGEALLRARARKNLRRMETPLPADLWAIIARWLGTWRARWIETMGFAASDRLVPGGCADGALSDQGAANVWGDAAAMIGLPTMTPHMARHAWATIYLAAHPGDYETVASLLGDDVETVRAHYGHDDGWEAAARLRRLLEQRYPDAFKRTTR